MDAVPSTRQERPASDLDRFRPVSVLLVEDDDGDALLVEDQLADGPWPVRIVRSRTLAEALTNLDSQIDCVLLDLQLPDAVGLEAVEGFRKRAPGIALIVLTGLDDEAAGISAVDAGAQDYLVKGKVGSSELARAIRYSIGRRQAEEASQQLRLAEAQAHENARLERGLAPSPILTDPTVWIASRSRPGRHQALLGGDFYDVVQAPNGGLRVLIGDVCGHGPDEAAIGVCLRASWRALALSGGDSNGVLDTLALVLEHERHLPSLFATLCILELEPSKDALRMILAGHPAPLLIHGEQVSALSQTHGGPPIGLEDGEWSVERLVLPSDWTILLYTDGITEARVGNGSERLGEDGLARLVGAHLREHRHWRENPHALLDDLIHRAEQLGGEALSDDVAMVLIGSGSPRPGLA
jgi:serine phosphatase RsbU (regulator of sigma subunit)